MAQRQADRRGEYFGGPEGVFRKQTNQLTMGSPGDIAMLAKQWFDQKGWQPFPFQEEVWEAFAQQKSGLLNAPTGSGKTYALWIPAVLEHDHQKKKKGLKVLWVTPLRALAKDLQLAMQEFCFDMKINWTVGVRTGDTSQSDRDRYKRTPPDAMIITPESLHLLLSAKSYPNYFRDVTTVVVDEWHELIGTKRGVQVELAISRLRGVSDFKVKSWAISATIGNLQQAKEVLTGKDESAITIKAEIEKRIAVESVIPEEIEKFPWSGHLGVKLIDQVIPIIEQSRTTLLFTNTRSQTELWYKKLVEHAPQFAGIIAMHHGSIDYDVRGWVEDALNLGKLKCVVCTSSLDLGVDFKPVDSVIQVGGPKGVSRFLQRAGRSGHQPGALSKIWFVPTHSLELIEGAALRAAIKDNVHEQRKPLRKCMDVLVQYLVTLAVGDGFKAEVILDEVRQTYAFADLSEAEWQWAIEFITTGGKTLGEYDEFSKVYLDNGYYKVLNRKTAMRHRFSIGTIVGDPVLKVKYLTGGTIGTVEESFVSKLTPGQVFWFGGRNLEFIRIKEMIVYVKKARRKSGLVPSWGGGRLPLSSQLSDLIKMKLAEAASGTYLDAEMKAVAPILAFQERRSMIPDDKSLLIEKTVTNVGHHVFVFPFEGRFVHEVLAGLIAYRIGKIQPITFSIAMNDYGFELLSDIEIPIEEALELDLFSKENLKEELDLSINKTEMAKRRFRDVATIAGLIFQGYPGKNVSNKHLQATSGIIYKVFEEYDGDNPLVKQAIDEVMTLQLDQSRFMEAMDRINQQQIMLRYPKKPTPF
ncbi:MAG: ligase-associated DNA damage response DEXH box helicase, partial [Bacteroidota bacterium]